MKKSKLILFDWGNIVESHQTGYTIYDAYENLFKSLGYNGNKIIYNSLSHYKLSTITNMKELEKTFNKIKKEFNLTKNFNDFLREYKYYFSKINYYKEVRDYEISLKDKCYIGILSNLTILDKERLDNQVGLNNYDYIFLSFELGYKKTDKKIYEIVSNKIPFKPTNVLFIDDRLDNILTAKEYGWNTFQATGLELNKIKKECQKFLDS